MKAINWLLLDNLINGWEYHANMSKSYADEALDWEIKQGFVDQFKKPIITDKGKGYFLLHRNEKV